MSDRFGISGGGRSAEDMFRQMTGAIPARAAADGDALLEGHPVEVKRATTATLNQVRALKYRSTFQSLYIMYPRMSGTWFQRMWLWRSSVRSDVANTRRTRLSLRRSVSTICNLGG